MKKIRVLLSGLFILALVSCEKEKMDDYGQFKSKSSKFLKIASVIINQNSRPISENGITPVIISGENKGGNRTCEEVASAFGTTFELCGEKLNYSDLGFDGDFPEGLNVTVEDIYVSFAVDQYLIIAGEKYKVGAVIVKGSNEANIYYYPNGTSADGGLAAPGDKKMVSNLTFCFVKCNEPELVIAVKSMLTGEVAYTVDAAQGATLIDYYSFLNGYIGKLFLNGDVTMPVGNIQAYDKDNDGLFEVTIDNVDLPVYMFKFDTYLFVGTLNDFNALSTHFDFPYHQNVYPASDSVTFDLPF